MSGISRVTAPLLDVVQFLLQVFESDRGETHGWEIMKSVKRSGPTVYGVLDRLEDAGWISSRWERENPDPQKPRRRMYRLTPNGTVRSEEHTSELQSQSNLVCRLLLEKKNTCSRNVF